MNPALNTAATGMAAQQTRTDVIANNLANVNTTSFKASRPNFVDLLYQTVQGQQTVGSGDANTTQAIQVGRGTRLVGIERVQSQGALAQTSQPDRRRRSTATDISRCSRRTASVSYTRDGSFQISDQGTLVTSDGLTVVPGIKIPRERHEPHDLRRTESFPRHRPASTASNGARPHRARALRESGRPARARRQPVSSRRRRRATPSPAIRGDDGIGQLQQGYLEGEQRRHRAGDGEHDRRAARVRDQLQGDLEQRHDDGHREQPGAVMQRRAVAPVVTAVALVVRARGCSARRAADRPCRSCGARHRARRRAHRGRHRRRLRIAVSHVGWVTRRVIHAGEALKEPAVAPPQLVRAGAEVTVRAETRRRGGHAHRALRSRRDRSANTFACASIRSTPSRESSRRPRR